MKAVAVMLETFDEIEVDIRLNHNGGIVYSAARSVSKKGQIQSLTAYHVWGATHNGKDLDLEDVSHFVVTH